MAMDKDRQKSPVVRVKGAKGLQNRVRYLSENGYAVLTPGVSIKGGPSNETWTEFYENRLNGGAFDGGKQRKGVPTLFASSGVEQPTEDNVGTEGLGWMEWGSGNLLPNTVSFFCGILPHTAAGHRFNTDLCAGLGPEPMYRYTQYVGGNITTKEIPYSEADKLIRGMIADKLRELFNLKKLQQENGEQEMSSGYLASIGANTSANDEDTEIYDELSKSLKEEIKVLQKDLEEWKKTEPKVSDFCERNNLAHTYLQLSGDMQMLGICFPEIQLNAQELDENGKPVNTALWNPRVVGIGYRAAHTCRLERMDEYNRINYVYVSNRWLDQPIVSTAESNQTLTAYPALSSQTPLDDMKERVRIAREKNVKKKDRPTRFIFPSYYPTVGRPYYPSPAWHSVFGGDIYAYIATIISDRFNRRKNSNVIGRIIYVHNDYMQSLFTQAKAQSDPDKQNAIRDRLYQDINKWLGNRDNSGQSLLAFTFMGSDGKEHKSFEIVEVESNSKSAAEANEKETAEVSSIIFMAMGLDAKLLGSTPLSLIGQSSGSDLRMRFGVKQVQMAPTQKIMLKALDVASRFNKWDKHLVWRINREVLTTLDNSKTGITQKEEEV